MMLSKDLNDYFDKLELDGIKLTDGQKLWYSKKKELLKEDCLREFPSTPEEAFAASQEGYWYASQLKELYENGRVTTVSYDRNSLVNCAWDIGQRDAMAIWFFQINRQGEIMIIDHFERTDTSLELIVQMLQQKGYTYGTHLMPFDANKRESSGHTFAQQARNYNLNILILEQGSLLDGINLTRTTMSKMWFDAAKCKAGLHALATYKKRWNSLLGGFTSEPVHDSASHTSDSLRYLSQGYKYVSESANQKSEAKALLHWFG